MDGTTNRNGTCRVVVDLRGIPWATDAAETERRLLARPGVLAVKPDPSHRRAVVLHEAARSLPALFNWVLSRRLEAAEDTASNGDASP